MPRTRRDLKKVIPSMRVWLIVRDAVDTGVRGGLQRATKHDAPTGWSDDWCERMAEHVADEIMSALDGVLDFGDPGE